MKIRFGHKPPAEVTWGVAASPTGKLVVGMTEKGEICRVAFLCGRKLSDTLAKWRKEWPHTKFSGHADVKNYTDQSILLVGTAFQQSVWRMMVKIPAGQTVTYGDIARRIGKAGAARAVGAACGANPVPYLVPCHRVVGVNGLGGFSGGVGIKEMLLRIEREK